MRNACRSLLYLNYQVLQTNSTSFSDELLEGSQFTFEDDAFSFTASTFTVNGNGPCVATCWRDSPRKDRISLSPLLPLPPSSYTRDDCGYVGLPVRIAKIRQVSAVCGMQEGQVRMN